MSDREEWVKKAARTMGPMMDSEDKFIYAYRIYDAGLAAREHEVGEVVAEIKHINPGGYPEFVTADGIENLPHGTKLYTHPTRSQGVPEGFCLDGGHRTLKANTGKDCSCPKYVRHPHCDRYETRGCLPPKNPWLSTPAAPQADEWAPYYEYPQTGKPVLGYHPDWVDEDFCPDGVRECFTFGDGTEWQSARWDGYSDLWVVEDGAPTLWIKHPQPPEQGDGV
ncbi:hypothetical protein [Marinobacter salarius]|nr:hypothetical protein [Marinobacter salarius]